MSEEQEASIELGATLLLSNSTNKYKKKWRSLYLGVLISVKWPTTSRPLSSLPYTSLPLSEPPARTSSAKSSVAIDVVEEVIEEEDEEEDEEEEEEERIRRIARIVKEQDLNSLHDLGGIEFVSDVLARQRQSQLPQSETGTTPVLGITSFCSFLFQSCKCNGYTILMLLISAVLSFAIGFRKEGPKHGWHDGVAIVCAVVLLLAGNSVANFWRERKMLKFDVKRGEESLVVPLSNIMVGDEVFLRPGAEVPAYGLLVSDGILEVAEPEVTKREKENPFLKSGSKVIGGGQGWMLVTSVESSMSYSVERRGGLLESLIEKPISYMDKVALFISVVIIFVVLIRLICIKDGGNSGLPEMKGKVSVELLREALERGFLRPQGRVSILTGLVSVVILSVQHGMPLVVTISLMYKIKKVVSKSNQKVVLNDLSACTTMGLVTVICIDASGGLISKPMEVSRIWMGEKDIITNVEGSETNQVVLDMLKQGVGFSVLDPELSLSPICGPLVSWAEKKREMNMKSFPGKFVILKQSKLNSDKEGSGVLVRKFVGNEQVLHLHWSGEACTILEMCSTYYDSEGQCHAMENQKIKFGEMIKEMEDGGLKSIAFAFRETKVEELEQDELILLGVIGLKVEHTCQESTKSALEYLRNTANIQIKLVSEDDIMVLKNIACELGIEVPPEAIVLEGKALQDLNDGAGSEKVDQALLMGSFCPQDKHRMVKCLQKKGHVVAFIQARLMTSNTSDLEADVGIVHDSLRIVNRDSFAICIQCFSGLKPIVLAGRSIYLNIQKFIQVQLTITISGLVITLITTICTGDSPLTAFQLFWVNVLVSPLGGLMMVMELTSVEELAKQPSNRTHRSEPIITKKMGKNIVIQVLYQVSVSMILEFGGHVTDREKRVRKTMIFNTFLICQLFNQLNTMQFLKKEVLKIVLQSYYFLVALGGCILMHVLVIEYAKGLSDCIRLNAAAWAICVLVGAFSWVVDWALKKILVVIFSTNSSSQSNTSPSQSNTSPSFYLYTFYLYTAVPFLMLLLFPLGLIFGQLGINMAFPE